jgi:hypothetical protein
MAKRNRNCIWHCGRETRNISRICDHCWADRDAIYQARKAREATQELNPKRHAAAKKAVEARRKKQAEFNAICLPASFCTELSPMATLLLNYATEFKLRCERRTKRSWQLCYRLFLGTPNNKAATMEKIATTAMSVKSVIAGGSLITSEDSSQRGLRINLEQAASSIRGDIVETSPRKWVD